ncbi:M-phase phosphoprotein 8 [Drosophila tropicalis]|uniref:M-phase phosphoprotein 8 n=1 Tax=Drosophila tropicalis TaxID=46794 RepID=UPI0035ABC4D3
MVKLGKKKLAEELSKKKPDKGSEEKNSKNGDDGATTDLSKEKDVDSKIETGSTSKSDSISLKRSSESKGKQRKSSHIASRGHSASKSDSGKEQEEERHQDDGDDESDYLPLNGRKGSSSIESSRDPPPSKKPRKQAKPKATSSKVVTSTVGKGASNNVNNKKRKSRAVAPDDDDSLSMSDVADEEEEPEAEDEKEFEVEAIVGHKTIKGVSYFLVRWKGYTKDSDSWEPEEDLYCDALIAEFRKKEKSLDKTGKPKPASKKSVSGFATGGSSGNGRGRPVDNAKNKSNKKLPTDPNKEWAVDRIIDFVDDDEQGPLYRIRWKGFGAKEDTWEPESNLSCEGLIEKFKKSLVNERNVDAKELRESPKKTKRLVNETIPRSNLHNRIERSSKRAAARNRVFYGEE